jgi:hypothetical protein
MFGISVLWGSSRDLGDGILDLDLPSKSSSPNADTFPLDPSRWFGQTRSPIIKSGRS